ncbi:MAG TPA: hypothetical protein VIM84_13175, partial [Gemmatimonadales bacterium]
MSNPSRILADPAATPPPYPKLEVLNPAIAEQCTPPIARVLPRVHVVHGETRVDDYHWLRERENPEVIAYLEAENRHAEEVMRHTRDLQERLYHEMRNRIRETDLSVPERVDDFLYYTRTEAGGQYPIFCRRRDEDGAAEEVLLDPNPLAEGRSYLRVGAVEPSPDHRLLAYSVDTSGGEEFTIFIKDLLTGELFEERLERSSGRMAWANDSLTIFYTVVDQVRRPSSLFRHQVGTGAANDVLVYYEPDASFYMDISRTRSRRYLLLDLSSHSSTEVRFTSADDPTTPFAVVQPRQPGVEYLVTHHDDRFFITTNDSAPNFRLVQVQVDRPSREFWTPVLAYRSDTKLDGTDAFREHLVVYERTAGLTQVRVIELLSGAEHLVSFPEPVYTVRAHRNPEFDTTRFRFTYTSMVTPQSVVEYDLRDRSWT